MTGLTSDLTLDGAADFTQRCKGLFPHFCSISVSEILLGVCVQPRVRALGPSTNYHKVHLGQYRQVFLRR
ncbi:hypothetical protein AGOR_G00066970 [Albula goreensis]|uniref:Uncharacterized protein n=1 Tax=Albula goreensis TaxID=1534307 RepID=A0A8T3DR54_9TELE|nr:hypothetical protein AGOR_G00066970 [Albula goreensis]